MKIARTERFKKAWRQLTEEQKAETISSLRRAVSNYGATIGSHNGGIRNPTISSISPNNLDYWHWGPDEALDAIPTGYPDGEAFARDSLRISFQDVDVKSCCKVMPGNTQGGRKMIMISPKL